MSTYFWVCPPVAGDGEEPPAWPAHLPENQFVPPSWEWRSVLWENGCEMGTVGCSRVPTPRARPVTPTRGSCHSSSKHRWCSVRPLRCSSPKAGLRDLWVSLLLSVGFSPHKCWRIRSNSTCPCARGSKSCRLRERGQGASTWCAGPALCPCPWGHTAALSEEGWELDQDRHSPAALLPQR